jgi:hypothetical protein
MGDQQHAVIPRSRAVEELPPALAAPHSAIQSAEFGKDFLRIPQGNVQEFE